MWSTAFRSLGTEVRVTTDDPVTAQALASLTSTYEACPAGSSAEACIEYRLSKRPTPGLFRDGTLIHDSTDVVDLPSLFQQDLCRQLIIRCHEGWILHSAALASVSDGRATLLVGPSDAGKSTLALALVKRGIAYITDECAVVDSAGQVLGITRPFSFSERAALPSLPPGFSASPVRCRSRSGVLFDAVLVAPPSQMLCHRPRPLRSLIVLDRDSSTRPGLRRLSAGEALCQLWLNSMRRDHRSLEVAIELLVSHEAHLLTIGGVDEACDTVRELMG